MFSWWRTDECSFTNFWCSIIKHNFLPVLNIRMRSWKYFAPAILIFLKILTRDQNFCVKLRNWGHFWTTFWDNHPERLETKSKNVASYVTIGLFVSGFCFRKTRWMRASWISIPKSVKKNQVIFEILTVRLRFSVLSIGCPEYAAWKSWKMFPKIIFLRFLPYCIEWSLSSIHVHISNFSSPILLGFFWQKN